MKRTRTVLGRRLFSSAHPFFLTAVLALGGLPSCSSGSEPPTGGDGGSSGINTGGKSGSGGSGGAKGGSGGSSSSGSGGSSASGGSQGSGGSSPSGGSSGSGGSPTDAGGSGGSPGTGGSAAATGGNDGGSQTETGAPDTGTSEMITADGCAGGTCLNKGCMAMGTARPIGTMPALEFTGVGEANPSYIPKDVVIPTFDDVTDRPYTMADGKKFTNFQDGDWTRKLLDFLEAQNLHVDFFVNANNFCDVAANPGCATQIKRILRNHNVASHTVHHIHMGVQGTRDGTPDTFDCGIAGSKYGDCEDELKGVESLINTLSNGGIPHLTRFRAPYGEPFLQPNGATASVGAKVAKYAIHTGWAMDSQDSWDDEGGLAKGNDYFAEKVLVDVRAGKRGLILMHGTYPWSVGEAKILLDKDNPKSFQKMNLRLGTVEDAICWKYGKHSWQIIEELTKTPHGPN
jgi:peptidoglycan/xylan/chitin deacetylase (PgdA/CDA1 family)